MKLKQLLPSLLLLGAVAFVACKGKPEDLIVKKWKAKDISGGLAVSIPDSEKKDLTSKIWIEFNKDGKFNSFNGSSSDSGTYTLSKDGKTLTTTAIGGLPEVSDVVELTNSKLIFTDKASSTKFTFEPK